MPDAKAGALLAILMVMSLVLSACSRQDPDEMTWARAALERNDRLEIVGADRDTRTFTVRNKETREVSVVRADRLIAVTTPAGLAAAPPPPAATGPLDTAATTAALAVRRAEGPAEEATAARSPAASLAAVGEAAEPAAPLPETKLIAPKALQPASQSRRMPGQVLAAGPGYSIQAGSGTDSIEVGPGFNAIEAGSRPAAGAARLAPAAKSATVELRHEPIVCQGARVLHIDNQNLQFDGDAVSAQDGCEIHITNSRIHAAGVGVSAHAANVHIDNSTIEGDTASIDVEDGAQVYAVSSTFRGMSRRLDSASVHDLGGNVWN